MPIREILYCLKGARTNGFVDLTCALSINPVSLALRNASILLTSAFKEVIHVTRELWPAQLILKLGNSLKTLVLQNPGVGFFQKFSSVELTENAGSAFCSGLTGPYERSLVACDPYEKCNQGNQSGQTIANEATDKPQEVSTKVPGETTDIVSLTVRVPRSCASDNIE